MTDPHTEAIPSPADGRYAIERVDWSDPVSYVREMYGVPAEVGRRVLFNGEPAEITGGDGHYLQIVLGTAREPMRVHPTWHLDYLTEGSRTMFEVKVYGASDDLIELDGSLYEEFSYDEHKDNYIAFGDGTVLQVLYTGNGRWHIDRYMAGTAEYEKVEATSDEGKRDDETPAYSDVVTLRGDLQWAVHGSGFARREITA